MRDIRIIFWFAIMGCLLGGCVTTTNRQPVDLDGALEKRIDLGMKYLAIDKRDNARYQFSKALDLNSRSGEAHHGIALVHQANGEFEAAKASFDKAVRLSNQKNRAGIYVSLGKFLMAQGKPQDACQYFEDAATDYDYGARPEALYLAAKCAEATGNTARIKPAYEHALNLNDSYAPVVIELADLYFIEGEYARSKRLLDKYMTLVKPPSARSLWLGIRIERIFENPDKESQYAMILKNRHPYSNEYLEYRNLVKNSR